MIHEEAVRSKHPTAREFRPVLSGLFSRKLLGWVFRVANNGVSSPSILYGWATADGEVSDDTLWSPLQAERNLRVYAETRPNGTKGHNATS